MKSKFFVMLILVFVIGVFGVSAQDDDTINIVATTTQTADLITILTEGVPEGTINLTALMGAGVDPHLYQPTESDIRAMNRADAVFYSGLHLEGQFDTVFEALGEQGVLIYAISDPVLDAGYIIGGFDLSEELTNVNDPHFWFDPLNWQLVTEGVRDVLIELDPTNAELYSDNAEAYVEQLGILFDWAYEAMNTVPEGQRVLVTSHDAFQYFGLAFGWQVRGLQGISTEDEAGVADIQNISQYVIENEIPVLFIESSVPPDAIEAVQEAINAGGGAVQVGVRVLFSDAMGEPDMFGGTYIGMIATNVYTILQSYAIAGVELTIPDYPADLMPQPDEELLTLPTE
ncbi:MAG: zinc ABC transporter substrate-binding protein [Aggregatilineales bacterium]